MTHSSSPVAARQAHHLGAVAVLAVLAALTLTLMGALTAAAHASLLDTDPADGAVVPRSPDEVTLTFNEPVQLRDEAVRVFDAAGTEVDTTARAVDAQVIVALPSGLQDGTYVVSWRVISADTHPVAGGFTFSVGAPSDSLAATPVPALEASTGVIVAAVAAQALGYVGLLGAVGLVAFRVLVLPPDQRRTVRARRLHRPATASAVMAVLALLTVLPLTSARQAGGDLSALADVDAWTEQITADPGVAAALVVTGLVVSMVAMRRAELRLLDTTVALFGAALALGSLALVGHTRTFGPAWLVLFSHLLHVTTAAVWFGGLIGLGMVLAGTKRARRSGPGAATAPDLIQTTPGQAATIVGRFSTTAAGLVTALAAAGVILGWRIVGSWSALFGTGYGITLLVKVGLVVMVLAVAAYNRYRLLPQMSRTPEWGVLRRTVRVEAAVIIAVLAATGLLVGQDPLDQPSTTSSAETGEPTSITVEHDLGEGAVMLRITPGRVGTNSVEFDLTDQVDGPLEPVEEPHVRLSQPDAGLGPIERPVAQTGPGSYGATGDFPMGGQWIVEISTRLSQFAEPVARIPVEIADNTARGGGHDATHDEHDDLLPTWLRAAWLIAFLVVAAVHVHHVRVMSGQRRYWHIGHVMMASGMAYMYLPNSDHLLPPTVGVAIFAITAVGTVIAGAWIRLRSGAINPLWALATMEMAIMIYMFVPVNARPIILSSAFGAYLAVIGALWAVGGWDRYYSTNSIARRYTADRRRDPSPTAVHAVPAGGNHRLLTLRVSLATMTAGMAYMLLAM